MAISIAIPSAKLVALLQSADSSGAMYVSIVDSQRLAIGANILEPSHIIDIGSESISGFMAVPTNSRVSVPAPQVVQVDFHASRSTGFYAADFGAERVAATSQMELLIRCLIYLEARAPGTLGRLSHEGGSSKRIVARDRAQLYRHQRLQQHAVRILDGWWVATNNNHEETRKFIRTAARLAGVGEPVRFS